MTEQSNKELIDFIRKNKKDYYALFRVEKDASEKEINTSYRQLARKLHPDRNKEEGAEECFKVIANVKNKLMDPTARMSYDTHGAEGTDDVDSAPPWEMIIAAVKLWINTLMQKLLSTYPYRDYIEEPLSPKLAIPTFPVFLCVVFAMATYMLDQSTDITFSFIRTSDLSSAYQLSDGTDIFISPAVADSIISAGISTSTVESQVKEAVVQKTKLDNEIDIHVAKQLKMRKKWAANKAKRTR